MFLDGSKRMSGTRVDDLLQVVAGRMQHRLPVDYCQDRGRGAENDSRRSVLQIDNSSASPPRWSPPAKPPADRGELFWFRADRARRHWRRRMPLSGSVGKLCLVKVTVFQCHHAVHFVDFGAGGEPDDPVVGILLARSFHPHRSVGLESGCRSSFPAAAERQRPSRPGK